MDTVKLAVKKPWRDGNLSEQFLRLGYPSTWLPGRYRNLPTALAKRVEQSGAQIVIPLDEMPEDKLFIGAPATIIGEEQKEEIAKERMEKEPRVKVKFDFGFRDGTLADQFAAINHPPVVGVGEVLELPASLFEACQRSGARMTQNPEEIRLELASNQQAKHTFRAEAWVREHEQQKAQAAQNAEKKEREAEIWKEIERLSARVIVVKNTGRSLKAREALYQRIDALYQEMNL
jgi:hypothetical protein